MGELDNTVAVITGAGRGQGRSHAVALAERGADIIAVDLCADIAAIPYPLATKADLDETARLVRAAGRRAVPVLADVRDLERLDTGVRAGIDDLGDIDIVIANAGVVAIGDTQPRAEPVFDAIVDTNLKGAFFCAQAAARQMSEGAIVNVCSLTSGVGVPTAVPYGSSKSGLLGMTRALAVEWAPLGIRVNGLGPGYFRTALTEVFYQDDAWQQAMLAKIPLARFGRLDDLVGASVFLCSDAAAYITGVFLPVDGGYLASI